MVNYVFYDDTDCGGIVYHARYFVFCERARSLIFFEKGLFPHEPRHCFVVRSIESNFIKALQLGDMYEVKTTPLEIKSVSLVLKQDVYKVGALNTLSPEPELVFSMQLKLAYIDTEAKKPCKILDSILELLEQDKLNNKVY